MPIRALLVLQHPCAAIDHAPDLHSYRVTHGRPALLHEFGMCSAGRIKLRAVKRAYLVTTQHLSAPNLPIPTLCQPHTATRLVKDASRCVKRVAFCVHVIERSGADVVQTAGNGRRNEHVLALRKHLHGNVKIHVLLAEHKPGIGQVRLYG